MDFTPKEAAISGGEHPARKSPEKTGSYVASEFGDMAVCFHSKNDFFNYACVRNNIPHFHNCWELHFLKSGSGVLEINSSERHILSAGDLCIIPPDVLHLLEPEPKTEHTAVPLSLERIRKVPEGQFSEFEYYSEILSRISEVQIVNGMQLVPLMEKIHTLSLQTESKYEHIMRAYIIVFFIELCNQINQKFTQPVQTDLPTESKFIHKNQRQWLVESYISTNYMSNNPSEELMELLHLSQRQTNRVVYQLMGASLAELITKQRIAMTKFFLQSTTMTLEEIAERVGYRSYSGFYNAVRKCCNTTPDQLARDIRTGIR